GAAGREGGWEGLVGENRPHDRRGQAEQDEDGDQRLRRRHQAANSSVRISATESKRSRGSLLSARTMAAAILAGRSGRSSVGGRTGCVQCAKPIAMGVSPPNGGTPVMT